MDKIAFVFSGQGDQHPGMGKALYAQYPTARRMFARFDALRPGTSAQCFSGTEEELKETKNTQPCLFALELAAASVLMEKGIHPDAVAGFSLGEVAAATVSGAFDAETGFGLVCRRGELMQQAAEQYDTFMAAVVKLSAEQVTTICEAHGVYPVNFNCPGQVSVCGLSAQMAAFVSDVKAAGGRAIPLKVKGAFHSPLMNDAADAFADVLAEVEVGERSIPLYSDLTAERYGEDVARLLAKQICHPVQWERLMRNLIADGIDTFIEIGPGQTLTNMIKKISGEVNAANYMTYLTEVEGC